MSDVPPSYEQAQHLRSYRACQNQHEEMARLLSFVWEEPGQCDLEVMADLVVAHVRRHDTYHSWFEERGQAILRHVIAQPDLIEMSAQTLEHVSAPEWQQLIASTPGPFSWDCFRFGVLQRENSFSCVACIDHLHTDSTAITFLMDEIHAAYRELKVAKKPLHHAPPGSYLDYCSSQHQRASNLTLADPDVSAWVSFLERNGGRMPAFTLPLGVSNDRCLAEFINVEVMDAEQTAFFETRCLDSGARMVGGLMAAAALTSHQLSGLDHFGVVTPTTTRSTPESFNTSGWYMGVVPVDFDVDTSDFSSLAARAQNVLDERRDLSHVPVERLFELTADLPHIRPAATGGIMLSYMNMNVNLRPVQSPNASTWQQLDGRIYLNPGMSAQVALWFFRTQTGLLLTAGYPANSTARDSIQRYVETFKNGCRQVLSQASSSPSVR